MTTTPAPRDERFEQFVSGFHIGASIEGEIHSDSRYPHLNGHYVYDDWMVQSAWAVWQHRSALAESELAEVREQLRIREEERAEQWRFRRDAEGDLITSHAVVSELRDELERVKKQVVPLEVLSFLTGYEPLEGVYFEDKHPARPGRYWWRDRLKAAIDAARGVEG